MTSHVDLFLKAANPGERAQTLVVRGAITVPTEGKRAALTDTHAALEARQETISRLCRAYLKTRVPIGRGAITVPTEGKRAALTDTPSARAF
jgi:hypothetical protein